MFSLQNPSFQLPIPFLPLEQQQQQNQTTKKRKTTSTKQPKRKMASVINFDDDCTQLAQAVKRGKALHAIFSICSPSNTCTMVPIPSCDGSMIGEEQWDHFISHLPKENCAYGLAEFKYISPTDGVERRKTVFVLWAPSAAPQKDKMMVAFSANGVVNKIGSGGIGCRVQAGRVQDLEYQEVLNQVLARSTVK